MFVLLQRTSNEVKERDSPVPRELRGLHSGSHLPVLRCQFSRRSVQRPGWVNSILTYNNASAVTAFFSTAFRRVFRVEHWESRLGDVAQKRQSDERCQLACSISASHQHLALPQRSGVGCGTSKHWYGRWRRLHPIHQSMSRVLSFRTHDVVHANVINRQLWSKCLDSLTTKTLSSQFSLMTRPALIG